MIKRYLTLIFIVFLSSCSCTPEEIVQFAVGNMENFVGKGFIPSEEVKALGKFQNASIHLSNTSNDDLEEGIIFLRLENGDPKILGGQREIVARNCAKLYLRDFEKAADYSKITIQFVQTDPFNPENVSLEEYSFDTQDF